jgi:hypothetical protein
VADVLLVGRGVGDIGQREVVFDETLGHRPWFTPRRTLQPEFQRLYAVS